MRHLTLGLGLIVACSGQGTPNGETGARRAESVVTASSSLVPPLTRPSASAPTSASASPSSVAAEASERDAGASDAGEAPHVKVITIGMHVGGGPYDEITKEPMKRSVEPRFAELAQCWKLVARPRSADFGVDLLIEAAGGRARVTNPRSTITDAGFVPCVVGFFEGVDFQPPRNGRTVVSYSVRFTP